MHFALCGSRLLKQPILQKQFSNSSCDLLPAKFPYMEFCFNRKIKVNALQAAGSFDLRQQKGLFTLHVHKLGLCMSVCVCVFFGGRERRTGSACQRINDA